MAHAEYGREGKVNMGYRETRRWHTVPQQAQPAFSHALSYASHAFGGVDPDGYCEIQGVILLALSFQFHLNQQEWAGFTLAYMCVDDSQPTTSCQSIATTTFETNTTARHGYGFL